MDTQKIQPEKLFLFTNIFATEKSCFAEGNIIQSMKVPLSKYVSGLQKGNEMYRNALFLF